jgi:hypothetical protein
MSDWADTGHSVPAYADHLHDAVLASFKAGCAPAPLPSTISWKRSGPALSGDRDFGEEVFGGVLGEAEKELAKATAPAAPACPIIP